MTLTRRHLLTFAAAALPWRADAAAPALQLPTVWWPETSARCGSAPQSCGDVVSQ